MTWKVFCLESCFSGFEEGETLKVFCFNKFWRVLWIEFGLGQKKRAIEKELERTID
jgi:hypothetical protein